MTYLRVRKFSELQHYADRPDNPWIKLYVRLLDDEELNALPITTRLLWDRLLLLAQRYANAIPNDPERLAKITCIPTRNVREGITHLLKGGWLSQTNSPRRASKPASNRASKPASPRARAQSREEEPPTPSKEGSSSLRSKESSAAAQATPNGAGPLNATQLAALAALAHREWDTYPDKTILHDELTDRGATRKQAAAIIQAEQTSREKTAA